ncbi:heme lyase CcmF/NrfE family subunit, partial [Methanosalsum natronophilum]
MDVNFGMIAIWLAFIAGFGAFLYSTSFYLNPDLSVKKRSYLMETLCTIILTFCVILLTYYLFVVNASYSYVFHHSSMNLEWYYRISALWAGQEGSLLLWVWLIFVMCIIFRISPNVNTFENKKLIYLSRTILLLIGTVFLLFLVIKNPFSMYHLLPGGIVELTTWNPFVYSFDVPYGQGMNPLLRNPWMAAHPPLLFVGYAAFTFPFVLGLSALFINDDKWVDIGNFWMRIAWIFLTIGIALGGFWAYEVLGWGAWYWTWDPVETASLIPWLTATAYLHAQYRLKHEEFQTLVPILAIFSFVFVVFATFVTRSGLWASVHAWQDFSFDGAIMGLFIFGLIIASILGML